MIDGTFRTSGAVRSARVHGAAVTTLASTAQWSHWDERSRTVWLIDRDGFAQATCVDDFSLREHSLARLGESVLEAHFVVGSVLRVLLVLSLPSTGVTRVVLARLDDGTSIDLVKPMTNSVEAVASLDGSVVLISSPWVEGVYARRAVDGPTSDDVDLRSAFEDGALEWALIDANRYWIARRDALVERSLDDPTRVATIVRFDRPLLQCTLATSAGSAALALFTRDDERSMARFFRADMTLWFECEWSWQTRSFVALDEGVVLGDELGAQWLVTPSGERVALGVRGAVSAATKDHYVLRAQREFVLIPRSPTAVRPSSDARGITSMALSEDGSRVVCSEGGERFRCYLTRDGSTEAELVIPSRDGHFHWVAALCEGDRTAAIVRRRESDRAVLLWRLDAQEAALAEAFEIDASRHIDAKVFAVSADGGRVVVVDGLDFAILSRRAGEAREHTVALPWYEDDERLFDARFGDDQTLDVHTSAALRRWDGEVWRSLRRVPRERSSRIERAVVGRVSAEASSLPGSPPVLWVSSERGAAEWTDESLRGSSVVALAAARDVERVVAAISGAGAFVVLDGDARELARIERVTRSADTVRSLCLSADGRVFVAGMASGQRIVVELEPE